METVVDGAPQTGSMRFGDSVRIEGKGKDGETVVGTIDQKVVESGAGA